VGGCRRLPKQSRWDPQEHQGKLFEFVFGVKHRSDEKKKRRGVFRKVA